MTGLVPFLVVGIAEDDTIGAWKNVVAGASLNIIKSGGGVASIYADEAGTTPISLPTTLDSSGQKMIFIAAGAYDVVIGGVSRRQDIIGLHSSPFVVETFASLATTPAPTAGMVVYLKQHTSGGIGGGSFITKAGVTTSDSGSISLSATAGFYFERIDPKKTPYEFGYVDGSDDVSVAVNACIAAYGDCFLDGGKTYDLQYTISNPQKFYALGGFATLNCTSPTGNGRFGSLSAAVEASGGVGVPFAGVDVQNIIIVCNLLLGSSGSTGIKGFIFFRCQHFYQASCEVRDCLSYGFWDRDISETGITYCSGVRDNCRAIDCQVGFEQVNVRGVTLNNCYGYISAGFLPTNPVECIYHAYGGEDMQLVYNNCTGVAYGTCPAIFLGLLTLKNVTMNSCSFLNYNNSPGDIRCSLFFEITNGDYDRIAFNDCVFKSPYSTTIHLTEGANGHSENTYRFKGCIIEGYQVGVQLNSTEGRYYFTDCDIRSHTPNDATPFGIYANGTVTDVKYIGGVVKVTTTGIGDPTPSNLSNIFDNTTLIPPTSTALRVRQRVVGTAVFGGDGSTYANINVGLPSSVLGWTSPSVNTCKISASVYVDYGLSGAADLPAAVAMAYPVSVSMIANDVLRLVGNNVLQGKTARYEVVEWE